MPEHEFLNCYADQYDGKIMKSKLTCNCNYFLHRFFFDDNKYWVIGL